MINHEWGYDKAIQWAYNEFIIPNWNSYHKIVFSNEELRGIVELSKNIANSRKREKNYSQDNHQVASRFMTGLIGELALEKVLGIPIIEYENYNECDARVFRHPDISAMNIGIKTVKYGRVPLITTKNDYPQIICFRYDKRSVAICGVANPGVLNTYQSESLVFSHKLKAYNREKKARGGFSNNWIKTGFYGFDHLLDISSFVATKKPA